MTERMFADFPSLHLHCGPAASSRRDQLRRLGTELFQSDQSPQTGACPSLVTKGSHFVALLRRVFHGANGHQGRGAFRIGRGQTLRAGQAQVRWYQCSTILPCRELCRHVACQCIADTLQLSVHRGATETWLRSIGLENTSVATCPSQQSLRDRVLSTISQDPGTSVSEY